MLCLDNSVGRRRSKIGIDTSITVTALPSGSGEGMVLLAYLYRLALLLLNHVVNEARPRCNLFEKGGQF